MPRQIIPILRREGRRDFPSALVRIVLAQMVLAATSLAGIAYSQDLVDGPDRLLVESPVAPSRLNGLNELVEAMLEEWRVPGLAVAIVEDARVVFSRGFGYRDDESKTPVDPQTLFAIGSVSKSFVVTGLGMLADEGALVWDRPVIDYMSDFRLMDPAATLSVTPRDLVTHRSGLPRHDGLWYGANHTREELFERLRYLQPSHRFRSVWQYQNLMFMTAGLLLERVSHVTWEQFTTSRIFDPLDMNRSNFSVIDLARDDNHALAYVAVDGVMTKVAFRPVDAIGPAGSINSSAAEMIRYVQLHLNRGTWGERQLVSAEMVDQMRQPQVVIPRDVEQWDEVGYDSYGMGLVVGTYRGHKILHHGGGIDGFISLMSMMPSKRIGMIILSNQAGDNPVPSLLSRMIYDRMLGMEPIDWLARGKSSSAHLATAKSSERAPRTATRPSHALEEYAGMYEHAGYGRLRIETAGESMTMSFNGMSTPLDHFHYDMFASPRDPLNPLENLKISFLYDKSGQIDRVLVPMEPAVADIEFNRVRDAASSSTRHIDTLVGVYRSKNTVVTVTQSHGRVMWLQVDGQPSREITFEHGLRYKLEGVDRQSVEFVEEQGKVTGLRLYLPSGNVSVDRQ